MGMFLKKMAFLAIILLLILTLMNHWMDDEISYPHFLTIR